MPVPKGSLTAAQYEIMAAIWAAGADGVSVADVWQTIAQARAIGRKPSMGGMAQSGRLPPRAPVVERPRLEWGALIVTFGAVSQ